MAKPSPSLSSIFSLLSISSLFLLHLPSAAASHHFDGDSSSDADSDLPLLSPPSPPQSSTQYWDEDEFEGLPPPPPPPPPISAATTSADLNSVPDSDTVDPIGVGGGGRGRGGVRDYYVEITSILFLILFLINYIAGKKENERLALAWGRKFAAKGSIFSKNFSLLGVGEGEGEEVPLMLKEGQSTFKFYASGRRFCQGLLATLELRSRHDLMSRVYGVVVGGKDEITVEVFMNEDVMDHVVFALGRKKVVKAMQKEASDLQRLGGVIAPGNGRKWVADELGVVGESKEVAGDMITEAMIDQVKF